jgi:tRNA A37 methylthiotransferase MiaB
VVRSLARAKNLAFRRALAGSSLEVLVLETRDRRRGDLVGLAGNYVEVIFPGGDRLMGTLATVAVTHVTGDMTLGALA